MNLQQGQSPYTPVGGMPPSGTPPVLGQQNPVTANELPAQGGLSVLSNPMAQQLQSQGRGEDSMLVHMTPDEVGGLQQLAMAHGGSLTINPQTGLPEAGFLSKLLPTIIGAALAATGVGAPLAAGIVGAGQFARTGSLQKGLMAGLGAFGGASFAGGIGLGGKIGGGNAFGLLGKDAGILGANMGAGVAPLTPSITTNLAAPVAETAASGVQTAIPITETIATGPITLPMTAPPAAGASGFFGKFAESARAGLPGGFISKQAPMLAGLGVLNSVNAATTPSGMMTSSGQADNSYQGPYTAQRRTPTFAKDTSEILGSSKERDYFDVDIPEVYNMQGQIVQPGSSTARGTPIMQSYLLPKSKKRGSPMYGFREVPYMEGEGFAEGGEVELADGAFVVDARTVSEIGNGSSNAGHELLARLGGRPVRGPGDGVSDSVPARIGRDQPARVARDEVIFSPEAVQRMGKGDAKRGAEKLYALMDKAHNARRKSERGKDTGLRKGLA